jgi:hypothetical protein
MVDVRLELAAGCPKISTGRVMNLCGVYYPDRNRQMKNPPG